LACSILGSVDGKKDAKAEEDEKPAIVGKEEASESGKKANLADTCDAWTGSGKSFLVR
jgi:hypothetical protein